MPTPGYATEDKQERERERGGGREGGRVSERDCSLSVNSHSKKLVSYLLCPQFNSIMFNWTNFTVLYSQWDALNEFSQAVGWDMVYGLNSKQRNPWPHGSWDTTNVHAIE